MINGTQIHYVKRWKGIISMSLLQGSTKSKQKVDQNIFFFFLQHGTAEERPLKN